MNEANIQVNIMLELSKIGCKVFRNNVGALKGYNGRLVRYGVGGKGGSDLIGICPDGKFMAIEVKTEKGRPSNEQLKFIDMVIVAGGRAGIARSAKEAIDIALGVV